MSQIGKRVYLNSIDRDHSTYPETNNYQINLAPSENINGGNYLRLDSVTLWNLVFPFTSNNNTLSFTTGGSDYSITIDQNKNYSPSQLATELTTKMNAQVAGIVTSITFDQQTQRFTYVFSANVTINSAGSTALFKLGLQDSTGSANTNFVSDVTSFQVKQIYLQVMNLNNSLSCSSGNQIKNCIALIPLDKGFGDIINYQPHEHVLLDIGNRNISFLSVRITDSNNELVNLKSDLTIAFTVQ